MNTRANLTLPADSAAVIVVVPTVGHVTRPGKQTLVDGIVIDWQCRP